MKKLIVFFLIALLVMTGCGKKEDPQSSNTKVNEPSKPNVANGNDKKDPEQPKQTTNDGDKKNQPAQPKPQDDANKQQKPKPTWSVPSIQEKKPGQVTDEFLAALKAKGNYEFKNLKKKQSKSEIRVDFEINNIYITTSEVAQILSIQVTGLVEKDGSTAAKGFEKVAKDALLTLSEAKDPQVIDTLYKDMLANKYPLDKPSLSSLGNYSFVRRNYKGKLVYDMLGMKNKIISISSDKK